MGSRLWENTRLDFNTMCLEWQGSKDTAGYGQLSINGKLVYVHRLSYESAKGKIPLGLEILHSCDNKICINPDHLSVGTHQDNMTDMASKGRGRSKFAESDVLEIRRRWANGEQTQTSMAKEFGITQQWINAIILRKAWEWLK